MNRRLNFIFFICIVMGWSALGCSDDSTPAISSDSGIQSADSGIKFSDNGIALPDSGNNMDGSSANDLSIDQNIPCAPNCSGRVCGPDPVCGTSCGPACETGQCNSQGQCVTDFWSWVIAAGVASLDYPGGIAVDDSGNAMVTGTFCCWDGSFGSTTLTSKGYDDILLAKVSPSGNVLWAVNYGGKEDDRGYGIAVDSSNNALITGKFANQATFGSTTLTSKGVDDIFVAKVSSAGDMLWAINAGGIDDDYGSEIAVDSSGNALVTGAFYKQATFGSTVLTANGLDDLFVAKISPAGDVLWAINAGGPGSDYGSGIAVDNNSNTLITGTFLDQAVFGSTTLTSKGERDFFIAKISPSGQVLWAINAGGSDDDHGYGIAVDSGGNALITGAFAGQATFGSTTLTSQGDKDIFIAKVSSAGDVLWAISSGWDLYDYAQGITVDGSDNVLVTGSFNYKAILGSTTLAAKGEHDIFITKVSPAGDVLWAISAGGTDYEFGQSIAVDPNGNILLMGEFQGEPTFGSTSFTTKGVTDIFVGKLSLF